MKEFLKVAKAISDQNRVKIIKMLQNRSLCVCEIQALLQIAQPSVSKHLKILENAGLVSSVKEGLWVNYQLADGSSSPYAASFLGNMRHWLSDDAEVINIVKNISLIKREDICRK
jgi:ArsR family transcriptional regulator